jgi:hypothetical protein
MSEENNTPEESKETKDYNEQEENWHLMVFCGMPWAEVKELGGDDREFLLKKADEGKLEVLKRKKESAEQQMAQQQAVMQQQQQQQAMLQQQQMAQQRPPQQQMQHPNPMMGMPPQMSPNMMQQG